MQPECFPAAAMLQSQREGVVCSLTLTARPLRCIVCCLQSSHKLQVVVVCEEALPRITYSARTNEVSPLTEALATEMVMEAEPGMSEVRRHCHS